MGECELASAIEAAPTEPEPRLAYAEWLEARGDERARLIRIEEEMRELPVFSDRFWELKPERNRLRERCDPEWLERMGYGFDREPVFRHGFPDDWRSRWRVIREFTERWHRLPMGDVGGRREEIAAVEARLGRELPASVRQWVAFAHVVNRETEWVEVLRDPLVMEELPEHAAITLLLQAEGDFYWAVRAEDLGSDDPPVYGYILDLDDEEDAEEGHFSVYEHNPQNASVTEFALVYAMGYVHADGGGFNTGVKERERLSERFAGVLPIRVRLGDQEIFEARNILARLFLLCELNEHHLAVEVGGRLQRHEIPSFVWDYTRAGGAFHGMFIPDRPGDS